MIAILLLLINLKAILGLDKANFMIKSFILFASVVVVLRNFLRAGTLKNKSSTLIVVPILQPISSISSMRPPVNFMVVPKSSCGRRVIKLNLDTAAIDGKASPRKPKVSIDIKSSTCLILLVA